MHERQFSHTRTSNNQLRGFVPFVAIILWFLLAILGARPAAASDFTLTAADIAPEIEAALGAHGMPADAQIELLRPDQPIANANIEHVSYNPQSGRFIIRLSGASIPVAGIAQRMEMLPVLTRDIARGEMIAEDDIGFVEAPVNGKQTVLTSSEDLIGKIARRPLRADSALRTSDVEAPLLVQRGAVVTLYYKIAGLRMTHQGVAMDDGASGDIISVKSIDSDRALKGVVTDRNVISIIPRRGAFEG